MTAAAACPAQEEQAPELKLLLRYQAEWFVDESRVSICVKSRRIGISWTSAAKHVFWAAEGKGDGWYIGYSEDQGEEFIRDVADWAKLVHGIALRIEEFIFLDAELNEKGEVVNTKEIQAYRVKFASGYYVTALSSRPRNLRGKQGYVTIDEAAYHDDLRGLIKAAIALLVWGGRVEIISTHDGVDNEFNKLIEETMAGKTGYRLHRWTLDDALADGLGARVALKTKAAWTPEWEEQFRAELIRFYGAGSDEELFCIPSKGGVIYLDREVCKSRMVMGRPVLTLEVADKFEMLPEAERISYMETWLRLHVKPHLDRLPKDRTHYMGQDFGRVSDLTVFAPGTQRVDLAIDVPFIVELINVPFEQQKQAAFYIISNLPRFQKANMDATGNGSYLAEVCAQKFGEHRIERVKITEPWHMENWPVLKDAFGEGKLWVPSNEGVLADLSAVKLVKGIPKLPDPVVVKNPDGEKQRRHGDAAIAFAMLLASTRDPKKWQPPKAVHFKNL